MLPISELIKLVESHYPDKMRLFYPRKYAVPATHYSPKHMAAAAAVQLVHVTENPSKMYEDPVMARYILAMCCLSELKMPTYWVTREFVEAMSEADPPEEMTVADLVWPVEGFTLIMPRDTIKDPDGHSLQFVSAVKSDPSMKLAGFPMYRSELKGMVIAMTTSHNMCNYTNTLRTTDRLTGCYNHSNMQYGPSSKPEPDDKTAVERDISFIEKVTAFVCNTMMYVMSLKDGGDTTGGITKDDCCRPAKPAKNVDALWNPTWIGRDYKHPSECGGMEGRSHASPRPHWRRTHFRRQPYGPGNSLRKTIMIKRRMIAAQHT